jgi:transcriptional regulator with XRE-family HTH domain
MKDDMRRGTPSAVLFGEFLAMIRKAGTRASMRKIGDQIGSPAATVSQVEKGQRALKSEKIALWAQALEVDEEGLRELWWMSQGKVPVGDRRAFYTEDDARPVLETKELSVNVAGTVKAHPDLEPIYRLAELMAVIVKRFIPRASVYVDAPDYEPLYLDKEAFGEALTGEEEDERAEHWAALVWQPLIWCDWDDRPGDPQPWECTVRDLAIVPVLGRPTPIVRKRAKSMNTSELEDLIRDLSGPERERVRGYIEALVEQRDADE